MKQKLMDMIECEKPSEKLVFNGRTKASDGIIYDQYLGDGKAYNTDGTTWYLLVLNHAALRAYMAEQGRKGGKKSKRAITKEQQEKMQAARKAANDVIQGPRSGPAGMDGQTMTETKKRTPKVSQRKIHENLQKGLDANGWSIFGTGGTKIAFIKPLVEYLRKAGIEVV